MVGIRFNAYKWVVATSKINMYAWRGLKKIVFHPPHIVIPGIALIVSYCETELIYFAIFIRFTIYKLVRGKV